MPKKERDGQLPLELTFTDDHLGAASFAPSPGGLESVVMRPLAHFPRSLLRQFYIPGLTLALSDRPMACRGFLMAGRPTSSPSDPVHYSQEAA